MGADLILQAGKVLDESIDDKALVPDLFDRV